MNPELIFLIRPHARALAVVGAAVLAAALVQLAPPLIMKEVVDHHLAVRDASGLTLLAFAYLAAAAGGKVLEATHEYLTARVAQRVLDGLRVRLFAHLMALPVAYHDATPLGELISRCTADVETVDTLFSTGVSTLVANLVFVATALAAMVWLSPRLSVVAALAVPPLVLVTRRFKRQVRAAERDTRAAVGMMNAHLQEGLAGAEPVRAAGREAAFGRRFRRVLAATLAASNRSTSYSSRYAPMMSMLSAGVSAVLIATGVYGAPGGISTGTLTAFVLLFGRFFKPIVDLGDQWQTVQSALSGAERIFQVLALPPATTAGIVSAPVATAAPLAVDVVSFGYVSDRPVLTGVSLTLAPGEQVALVGRTGAGKTSLLHLAAGLSTPWSGAVRVRGADPCALAPEERRRLLGVVPQVVQLFTATLEENLTLGDPAIPREQVERALELAGLASLVARLPAGLATPLGGAGRGPGARLSAGEAQLVALARALVHSPALLLLDEATSTIDSASEAMLRAALERVVREHGLAVLTVAHRLASARAADRVMVMEDGRIVEEGAPGELERGRTRFASLLELEASGWSVS